MKKDAFIWRESIYKAATDGIFRCNDCKCKLYDANTGEVNVNMATLGYFKNYLFCPDCKNCVGRITKIEDDNDGYFRGEWKEKK